MNELSKFLVDAQDSLLDVMSRINETGEGIVFVTDLKRLVGVITDGDIRRSLIDSQNTRKLAKDVMNTEFVYLHMDSTDIAIRDKLSESIKFVPLVNDQMHVMDVASRRRLRSIPIMEPVLSQTDKDNVNICLDSGWISSQGSFVNLFEQAFEQLCNNRFAVSVSNGTTALHLALMALKVGSGDEVIIPNLTFAACANAVEHCRAKPVLCDVKVDTWCIDESKIEELISPATKAIMVVHLYGQIANMDAIMAIASKHKLFIIEDCAEALGSEMGGQAAGSFGDVATFSFFGNKTITTGEGGMAVFASAEAADYARVMRDHGMRKSKRYWHDMIGFNYRLTNIQAALGVSQMERLKEIVEKKRTIAAAYKKRLEGLEMIEHFPGDLNGCWNSYWLFNLVLSPNFKREDLLQDLLSSGVDTRPFFYPLHQMEPYSHYKRSADLRVSEHLAENGLSLPSSLSLDEKDIDFICLSIRRSIQKSL